MDRRRARRPRAARQPRALEPRDRPRRLASPADDEALDRYAAFFARNGGRYETDLAPFATPADVRARLAARGLRHVADELKWWRDASPADAARTSLRIVPAETAHTAAIDRVMREGFGSNPAAEGWLPGLIGRAGWHVHVALDGADVVAAAACHVRDGLAWLGIMTTRPDRRRLGAQAALLASRIEAARTVGAKLLTLETLDDTAEHPNPSPRNVARAGFRLAYRREIWSSQPDDGDSNA